jgi:hypothetical protein
MTDNSPHPPVSLKRQDVTVAPASQALVNYSYFHLRQIANEGSDMIGCMFRGLRLSSGEL